MQAEISQICRIPKGMPIARYAAPKEVELPKDLTEVPLIDPKKGSDKQLQLHLDPHVDIFDLGDDKQREECEKVWKLVCEGKAKVSENRTEFVKDKGTFIAMLRWSMLVYKLPEEAESMHG